MARMRTIKPEFFRSATIGQLSREARLLFIGMWCEADDHGRGLAEPKHLAGSLFPFDRDVTEKKIGKCVEELSEVTCTDGQKGLIVCYESGGRRYYVVRNWWHQKPNKPGAPRYPSPPPDALFGEDIFTESKVENATSIPGTEPVRGQGSRVRGLGSKTKPKTKTLAADRGERANPLWDALSEELGEPQTRNERSRRGRVVKDLREVAATPEDVRARCAEYRTRWPNIDITDTALVNHWTTLGREKTTSLSTGQRNIASVLNRIRGGDDEPGAVGQGPRGAYAVLPASQSS